MFWCRWCQSRLDVAVHRREQGSDRRVGADRGHAPTAAAHRREGRELAQPALLPEREQEQAGHERGQERGRLYPPGRDQQAEHRSAEEERVRRLEPDREAADQPGEDRVRPVARVEGADEQPGGDEQDDGRGEVRQDGQSERLRQRDVDVLLVVALVEHGDRRVGDDDPERGRPVAEDAAGDPGGDPVHAEQGDGEQEQRVEHDHHRQPREDVRAGEERNRDQQVRPGVADQGDGQRPLRQQVRVGPVVGLVAALVVEPAVVRGHDCEDGQGEPLDDEQRAEDAPGLVPRDQRPEPPRRLSERHARAPVPGTTRSCAPGPRAAASSPRSRTAPARGWRRGCGAAVRSASTRPSGSRR